jgi:hypothetical protein
MYARIIRALVPPENNLCSHGVQRLHPNRPWNRPGNRPPPPRVGARRCPQRTGLAAGALAGDQPSLAGAVVLVVRVPAVRP